MRISAYKNGVIIDNKFVIDSSRPRADAVNLISHAHSDHLAKNYKNCNVIASALTKKLAELRNAKNISLVEDNNIQMLDAGHIPGSNMFLFNLSTKEGIKKVLYTGDISLEKSFFSDGAKPIKTDVLIIESTYGTPYYKFPKRKEVMKEAKEWIADSLKKKEKVALLGYSLGKAQQLCNLVEEMHLGYAVHSTIHNFNTAMNGQFNFSGSLLDKNNKNEIIIAPSQIERSLIYNYKITAFSGWALDSSFKSVMDADMAFPLSDHADFYGLMNFVEKCSPSVVYTHHGFSEDLAKAIRERLHIFAEPLKDFKQRSLVSFFNGL